MTGDAVTKQPTVDEENRAGGPYLAGMLAGATDLRVVSSGECAWLAARLAERDDLAMQVRRLRFDLESAAELRDRYREFARTIQREAGSGVALSAYIRGRALDFTPAKRQLVETVAGWVDEWSARVEAVGDGPVEVSA